MTELHPLAAIRRQGFDADLHQGRVRVWPRHKATKTLAQFVTANLPAINEALAAEDNMKSINNVLLFELPRGDRGESEPPAEGIPDYMNGQRVAGIPAPDV